jgi:hypothetical protein
MQTKTGDMIVEWLFAIADNTKLPRTVRMHARDKIFACALRMPSQTVMDVMGTKH